MSRQEDFGSFSLPTEIWVVAQKRKDGELPDVRKIMGMAIEGAPKTSRYGESVFFMMPEDAQKFLSAVDPELRKYFSVYRAWMEIKEVLPCKKDSPVVS